MGWHEQVLLWRTVWLETAPFEREVPLLALIPLIDAFSGLSQRAAVRLRFVKRGDIILLAVLLALEIRFIWWRDFFPWWIVMDSAPRDPALFDAWTDRMHLEYLLGNIYLGLIFGCALVCAIWAKLQKRSFSIWLLIGLIGTGGAVVWLFVNRLRMRSQDLQTARP